MKKLSECDEGINWIKQFSVDDQFLATKLINKISLVTHDSFISNLRKLIIDVVNNTPGIVALFAEREIKNNSFGVPIRLFKQPSGNVKRRAEGMGPQPVLPVNNNKLLVGSEGIISWLVSELCKEFPNKMISHPSPDKIRDKEIKKLVLVTDLIGSGTRAHRYLESAWSVASVKSWKSLKYLSFDVITYAATNIGMKKVLSHKSKPNIYQYKPCPTINSEFTNDIADKIKKLCVEYDPINKDLIESLGFKGSGSLIVFSHGCPNNLPRIIHRVGRKWVPLFPKRVTSRIRDIITYDNTDSNLKDKLEKMHENKLLNGLFFSRISNKGKKMIVFLVAMKSGPRFSEAIARKTGLSIPEIEIYKEKAFDWGWITKSGYLTKSGRNQINYARRQKKTIIIRTNNKKYYFPKSLRVPSNVSS